MSFPADWARHGFILKLYFCAALDDLFDEVQRFLNDRIEFYITVLYLIQFKFHESGIIRFFYLLWNQCD